MTPFFANYGREPEIERGPLEVTHRSQEAEISAKQLKNLHESLRKDIEFMNQRIKHYYDLKRQEAPQFKKGEKVFLLRRNIKTKRPSDKLDYKKLGLFKISKKIGQLNYKPQLPNTMRNHLVFHILLLEKANQDAKTSRTKVDAK